MSDFKIMGGDEVQEAVQASSLQEPAVQNEPAAVATPAVELTSPTTPTPAASQPEATAATPRTTHPTAQPEQTKPAQAQPAPVEFDPYKELGIEKNPYNEKLMDSIKAGKVKEFLEATTVDYQAMSDEDLLKMQLQERYPELSAKNLDRKLKEELADKYKIGGFDEDEEEYGRQILKGELRTYRDGKIGSQQAFKLPESTNQAAMQQADAQQQAETQRRIELLNADPVLNDFEMKRTITIGTGEEAFNYEVPKEVDVRASIATNSFLEPFHKSDGSWDMQKWVKAMAFTHNMDAYDAALIKHGETRGAKKEFDGLRNPKVEITSGSPTPTNSTSFRGIVDGDKVHN